METRLTLPVYQHRQNILDAINNHDSMVIVGETGSGKTTQIPQYLLEQFMQSNNSNQVIGNICVTQPRRIAAITVAQRVCQESNIKLGNEVGYTIRFEDKTSSNTHLRYVTDGILLREACTDPLLLKYDCVIIDEAHERTLDTDLIIGLVKNAMLRRNNNNNDNLIGAKGLKVVIMSATLNVEKFSDFFNSCPIFTIPGRTHEVIINHHPDLSIEKLKSNYIEKSVDTALQIHFDSPIGDILIFLTGQQEIHRAISFFNEGYHQLIQQEQYQNKSDLLKPLVVPIYAALEHLDQKLAFEPCPKGYRKIIFATNIAQTSITIPGIVYVVDCGFVKQKMFEPKTGMDALLVVPISRAAAIQRAGRAGRTQQGIVYRLYSKQSFEYLIEETIPEIQRSSLLSTCLTMKAIGIKDLETFPLLDPPSSNHLRTAIRKLSKLGAIDSEGDITPLGNQMSRFPLSPYLSCALIYSSTSIPSCSYEMLVICCMLSIEYPVVLPKSEKSIILQRKMYQQLFNDASGDHITLYNIFKLVEKNNFSKQYCYDHYLNQNKLLLAKSILNQLILLMNQLKLPIVHLNDYPIKSDLTPSKRFNVQPILKCLCRGYFLNVAKKSKHSYQFYHYGSSTSNQFDKDDLDLTSSSNRLLALHLHSTSTLSLLNNNKSKIDQLDWIIYSQILYTNQCQLRFVSQIEPNWFLPFIQQAKSNIKDYTNPTTPTTPSTPIQSRPSTPTTLSPARLEQLQQAKNRFLLRKLNNDTKK